MKLTIKSVEIKNFLSVGSQPIKFEFTKGIHAIMGKVIGQQTNNGVGKSTIGVDSIIFAFYGKSIRGLNQNQMINSINDCDCYVHLSFDIDGHPYRIERGLKPNYLRFIDEVEEAEEKKKKKDEQEDKEKAAKKSTQKDIDDKLNMSLDSFKNMITLNINYSTPFFKMSTGQKRDLLENIMNLSVFGRMFDKAKEDFNELKKEIKLVEVELKGLMKSYKDRVETYKKLEKMQKDFDDEKEKEIEEISNKLSEAKTKQDNIEIPNKNYETIRDKLADRISQINAEEAKHNQIIRQNNNDIRKTLKRIDEMKANPVCPICNNPTDSEHSAKHEEDLKTEMQEYESNCVVSEEALGDLEIEKKELKPKLQKAKDIISKIEKMKLAKQKLRTMINSYESQLEKAKKKTFDVEVIDKAELIKDKKDIEEKKESYKETKKKYKLAERMKVILGDGGIKNYTIRKILPYLNKKMNQHLAMLNAHYTISFDSQLKETLKSRNRDEFTYENFSGGEQKRIDLAWMFTTVSVSRMRNSVDCNILVLDEVLDSSMCSHGIGMLMSYLKTEFKQNNSDHCVYIITHKSEISEDDFDTIIRLKKENHFTKIDSIDECEPVIQV